MTACQQACPPQAISFGNLADPRARVAQEAPSPRNYALLGEQGTRPRTTYLARIGERRAAMASRTARIPSTRSLRDITREVARVPLQMPARMPWLIALILSLALLSLFLRRSPICSRGASASGASTSRSTGHSRSTFTSGGSGLGTPGR